MKEVVIVSGVRTAIGDFGGSLKTILPLDLSKRVIKEVINRAEIRPEWIDKVIFGCCFAPLEQNVARNAAFLSGIPKEVPGFTINSTCGSSLQSVISAIQAIQCGEAEMVLAGGVESMSNAPFIMTSTRWGQKLRHAEAYDLVWKGMQEPFIGVGMGLTAENLAAKYQISREEQDAFAVLSHVRAAKAIKAKKFVSEIVPVTITSRNAEPVVFDTDEHVRNDIHFEKLAKLSPAFKKDGTVTPGNACSLNDAASAVILVSRQRANELGLKPVVPENSYHMILLTFYICNIKTPETIMSHGRSDF